MIPKPKPELRKAPADSSSAEEKLRKYFESASQNFLDENERIFSRKAAKIQSKHESGLAILSQAEQEVEEAIQKLTKDLAQIRERKSQLEQARSAAMEQARLHREHTAEEFLRRQEETVKAAIDQEMLKHKR